jgi:polar amino acid transport system substrate-binding protein
MIRNILVAAALALLSACSTVPPAARNDLAPGGKLRAGINFQNQLLTGKNPATGEARGIVVDIAKELGRRLGVPVEIVGYDTAGKLAADAKTGAWDIGFLGADAGRPEIAFSAAYVEVEASYLVPAGSTIKSIADADREGVRIAVAGKSAYELYLSRNLKRAQLVRTSTAAEAARVLVADKLEALADLKPRLLEFAAKIPGSRVLDGRFTVVDQAVGMPAGREAGLKYLREFVEDIKKSGFVARTIENNNVHGLTVAPASK